MTTPSAATPDAELHRLSRSCWVDLEVLHVVGYFAPEVTAAYVALGLHPRLSYFAARSAAFGPVGPEVTTATFYVFAPWLAARAVPAAWDLASPAEVQAARRAGVRTALTGLLGTPDVAEALALTRRVCAGLRLPGRPLYAAHLGLAWPEDDLTALWHAAVFADQGRGDGHVAVLQEAELDPVEALVLDGLYSSNTDFVRSTRGWTEEQWQAGVDRLGGRGLINADGRFTQAGRALRQHVEQRTDALSSAAWEQLGVDDARRLHTLLGPLRRQVLAGGVLPDWFERRGSVSPDPGSA